MAEKKRFFFVAPLGGRPSPAHADLVVVFGGDFWGKISLFSLFRGAASQDGGQVSLGEAQVYLKPIMWVSRRGGSRRKNQKEEHSHERDTFFLQSRNILQMLSFFGISVIETHIWRMVILVLFKKSKSRSALVFFWVSQFG